MEESQTYRLTEADFAELFGVAVEELASDSRRMISERDFRYRQIGGREKDELLADIFKKIDSNQFSRAGKEGKGRWEKGWQENYESFVKNKHNLSSLTPKYIRPIQPLRLNQDYIMPFDPEFEFHWYEIFRRWLFRTFFETTPIIYEFGCGSGFNLGELATLYPDRQYYGLDWARPSVEIVNEMAKAYGWNMKGIAFDFFAPDYNVKIPHEAAVLTIGALEQTGTEYEEFLKYLLSAKPSFCLHIEPILEWYDKANAVDQAAIRFHEKRNYWVGFPSRLQELERKGKVKILKTKRSYFGSLYLEGYSQLIWRPM